MPKQQRVSPERLADPRGRPPTPQQQTDVAPLLPPSVPRSGTDRAAEQRSPPSGTSPQQSWQSTPPSGGSPPRPLLSGSPPTASPEPQHAPPRHLYAGPPVAETPGPLPKLVFEEGEKLVFEEGETEKAVSVRIVNDGSVETDERYTPPPRAAPYHQARPSRTPPLTAPLCAGSAPALHSRTCRGNRIRCLGSFSVVFSNADGGASFSAECDGGPQRAIATITISGDDPDAVRCPPRNCAELAYCTGLNLDEASLTCPRAASNEPFPRTVASACRRRWAPPTTNGRCAAVSAVPARRLFAWSSQFADAVDYDSGSGLLALLLFLLSLPWKLAVAFAPPPRLFGGWACFVVVLGLIGVLTALIGDVAAHMGCCMGLQPSITAITFVALGTSLPDTFASKSAALSEEYADASIGNITGSNSVNVFLGLGLPWMAAAFYWASASEESTAAWHARYSGEAWYTPGMAVGFAVPAGTLGVSVAIFSACAVLTLGALMFRRATEGFELGGPSGSKYVTGIFMASLWGVYIAGSILFG